MPLPLIAAEKDRRIRARWHVCRETLFDSRPCRCHRAGADLGSDFAGTRNRTVDDWIAMSPLFRPATDGRAGAEPTTAERHGTFCTKNATARLVCYLVCQFDHAPQTRMAR